MISFPCLFKKNDYNNTYYEVDVLYRRGSAVHQQFSELDEQAIRNRWPDGAPKGVISCIKSGDEKNEARAQAGKEPLESYDGMLFSKLRTQSQPRVTGPNNEVIDDPMLLKGGNICVLSVSAFPYDNTTDAAKKKFGKKGIWLTLYGLRKLQEGKVFGAPSRDANSDLDSYEADTGDEEF